MRPKLVFTGPTLSHPDALKVVDAVCLPPAVQGSIVSAVQRFDPSAILVIDGGFQAEPAVRHKEILWALSRGIHVVGAASMGALRAAELFPHMQGVGLIYRWYRRFAFAPDDAVAVLHGPAEVNFTPLTHAMIDLRRTLRAACRRGMISPQQQAKLEGAAQAVNFRERTLARMVRDAHDGKDDVEKLCRELGAAFVQQKKQDALRALELLREQAFEKAHPMPELQLTSAFSKDMDDTGLAL
ncbi:TfuA-like protein [Mesorhizobium sp. M0152]|uniref:TfuA-like protein n=1 Tax=Mesorhizobium sp. M0152 TaxID=2956898 RepID=UPI003335D2F3